MRIASQLKGKHFKLCFGNVPICLQCGVYFCVYFLFKTRTASIYWLRVGHYMLSSFYLLFTTEVVNTAFLSIESSQTCEMHLSPPPVL